MTRYILHIGPHKTGTTTIQICLSDDVQRLDDYRVSYPTQWRDQFFGHHSLVTALRQDVKGRTAALETDFERINTYPGTNVLSSENLATLTDTEVARLADLIGPREVVVYYYIRRWDKLIWSSWQEDVKHGIRTTFPHYYAEHIKEASCSPLLNYGVVMDRFARAFGDHAMRAIIYDNVVASDENLLQHFYRVVLDLTLPDAPQIKTNMAFGPCVVEMIRSLYVLEFGRAPGDLALRQAFLRNWQACQDTIEALAEIMRRYLIPIEVDGDGEQFRMVERRLLERYGDQIVNRASPDAMFHEVGKSVIQYVESGYLIDATARTLLEELHEALCESEAQ